MAMSGYAAMSPAFPKRDGHRKPKLPQRAKARSKRRSRRRTRRY